jgi:hypothetical protein
MNADSLIGRLEHTGRAIRALASGVPDADARWKPESGAWSILEIVCHLADEEESDFRVRLRSTLEDPSKHWPGIDPEGWARERRYNEQDLAKNLDRFTREREASLEWLRSLDGPDWSRAHAHLTIGELTAGDLLASWAAHDALHLRQITKRLFELTERDAGGCSTRYAGSW